MVEQQRILVAGVYASTNVAIRKELLRDLQDIVLNSSGSWLIVGDFNAILGTHEQRGGRVPSVASCQDFRNWSEACSLFHLPSRGAKFTWTNGRGAATHIERRLDRALCNEELFNFWSSTPCNTLSKTQSDHHPLLVTMKKGLQSFPSSFKFQSMWIQHED